MTRLDQHLTARPEPAVNGSAPAPEALVRTFNEIRDELISTLLFVLGNRDDAQDAAQEAFVKCWGVRDQLAQVRNLRAWIFRVGFNTAKDMQRSAWHRRARPLRGEQFSLTGNHPAPAQA